MARSRNIKPGFFKNEVLAEMSAEARLLFIGLWTLADREGRLEDRPKRIRAELFPFDMIDTDPLLDRLVQDGFLIRYESEGARFIQIENFTKHQQPHHKEVASVIPSPEGKEQMTRHAYEVSAVTRAEVFQRDGNSCLKCGSTENLSIDHIVPLACGGDNAITNLQTLCTSCNSSKRNTTMDYRKAKLEAVLSHEQINVGSCMGQAQANHDASCPTDSLLLIPDSLIPDPLKTPVAEKPAPRRSASKFDPAACKPTNVTEKTWADWCQHRREIKKPLTAKSCEHQASELAKHPSPDLVIQASIKNGWTGLFPEKVTAEVRQLPSRHTGFENRDYTAGLIQREDGSYGF